MEMCFVSDMLRMLNAVLWFHAYWLLTYLAIHFRKVQIYISWCLSSTPLVMQAMHGEMRYGFGLDLYYHCSSFITAPVTKSFKPLLCLNKASWGFLAVIMLTVSFLSYVEAEILCIEAWPIHSASQYFKKNKAYKVLDCFIHPFRVFEYSWWYTSGSVTIGEQFISCFLACKLVFLPFFPFSSFLSFWCILCKTGFQVSCSFILLPYVAQFEPNWLFIGYKFRPTHQ